MTNYQKLSPEEFVTVGKAILQGDIKAVHTLVNSYSGHLHFKAQSLSRKFKVLPSHHRDVHSLFVMTALEKTPGFDFTKGSFPSFLKYDLQDAFFRYVSSFAAVSAPAYVFEVNFRLQATCARLSGLGLPITKESLQTYCNATKSEVANFLRLSVVTSSVSVDELRGSDGASLLDRIESEDSSAFDILAEVQLSRLIRESLQSLSPREAQIVKTRHLGYETVTFDSIAQDLKISKQRAGQIEAVALKKIRQHFEDAGINKVSDLLDA